MQKVVRRAEGLLLAVLVAGTLAACGTGGAGGVGGTSTSAAASGPVDRPYHTALQAALGFVSWFQADASDCEHPDFVLDGRLPQAMLDSFSCRQVLTPSQIRDGCKGAGGASSPHAAPFTLATGRLRYVVDWNRGLRCDTGHHPQDRGTYEVVAQQYADGWSIASYKILTGPGAGTSG